MKIYVGAGSDAPQWSKNGWTCNDVAEAAAIYPGIELVGPCWDLKVPDDSVDEILAKGMIEHMTYREVEQSFAEWRRVLKPGGHFTGDVPDIEEYLREYLKMRADPSTATGEGDDAGAEGEPDDREVCTGIDRWLRRAMYGWQRWPGDEHRSGWKESYFRFYVEKYFKPSRYELRRHALSFEQDEPVSRVRNLFVRAWK